MSREVELTAEMRQDANNATTTTTVADWAGWERWLKGHLAIELKGLYAALGQLLATERRKLDCKMSEFELNLAKLSGAIDVLRGAAPPPPAKFPNVETWSEGAIYYERDVVTHDGNTWQAQRDTASAPGSTDWTCLAAAGEGFVVRGKYLVNKAYQRGDVAMLDGSAFVALKDAPGVCPGDGWRLLAMRGSRGRQGPSGQRGLMGLRGERGEAAPTIRGWEVDRARYVAIPVMSDGTRGPALDLRGLFEQFLREVSNG